MPLHDVAAWIWDGLVLGELCPWTSEQILFVFSNVVIAKEVMSLVTVQCTAIIVVSKLDEFLLLVNRQWCCIYVT